LRIIESIDIAMGIQDSGHKLQAASVKLQAKISTRTPKGAEISVIETVTCNRNPNQGLTGESN
jgi:hypothetical protein